MIINQQRLSTFLAIMMTTVLYMGYIFTTGTRLIESELAQAAFRISAVVLSILIISMGKSVKSGILLTIFFIISIFLINQNLLAANMIFLMIIVASLYRIDHKSMAIAFLLPSVLAIAFHFLALNIGLISSATTEFGTRSRSTFGFTNANQAAMIYLSLVFASIFAHLQYKSRWSYFAVITSILAATFVMIETDSRTSLISLTLLIVIIPLWKISQRKRLLGKIARWIAALTPILGTAISFYLVQNSNPALNELLSLRPFFFAQFFEKITLSNLAFGWKPAYEDGVDNGYLMLFSLVGMFGYMFFAFLICRAILKMKAEYVPLIVVLLVASIFESFLVRPEIPVAAMFILMLLWRNPYLQNKSIENYPNVS